MTSLPTPSNPEAEAGVLSCLLTNPRSLLKIIDTLQADHFENDTYGTIYEAILHLYERGKVATLPNVRDELRRMHRYDDIVDKSVLEELEDSIASVHGTITDYADNVRSAHQYREIISMCQHGLEMAFNRDNNTVTWLEESITKIALGTSHKEAVRLTDAVDHYMKEYEQRRKDAKEGKAHGVPTGFRLMDKILGGLKPSRLYVLAARPSIGKTALSLNMGLNIIQQAKHVAFFSLEMDEDELVQRLFSMETQIDQSLLRDATTDEQEDHVLHSEAARFKRENWQLEIIDRIYTLSDIKSTARHLHAKQKLDLIVIDYLQLIDVAPEARGKNGFGARHEEVGKISRELKRLARDLKVPILTLAQLNRKSEESELPQLHHLGESSKIEQDADVVAFIHCEELELEKRNHNQPYRLNVLIRKHRNGRIGQAPLLFRPRTTKFEDDENDEEVPE